MKRRERIIPGGGFFSQKNGILITNFLYAVVAQEEPLVFGSLEGKSVYAVTLRWFLHTHLYEEYRVYISYVNQHT